MMRYISPGEKVFSHLDRVAEWQQRGGSAAPVSVEFDLSNRCSLGCEFCHFAHTHTRGPWATESGLRRGSTPGTVGDLADPVMVVRVLDQMATEGVRSVVWSGGGEPSLHPEFAQILDHTRGLGLKQGVYTLGATLDGDEVAALRAFATWVVVSLDAASALDYAEAKRSTRQTFERACASVAALAQGDAVIGASFMIGASNWRKMDAMRDLARDLGATYATFRPMILTDPDEPGLLVEDPTWVSCAFPDLLRLSKDRFVEIDPGRFLQYRDWVKHPYETCYGIRLHSTITPDGRVWLCPNRRGDEGALIGDVSRESFRTVWARHPGHESDLSKCRAMCRLHPVNETMAVIHAPRLHAEFV